MHRLLILEITVTTFSITFNISPSWIFEYHHGTFHSIRPTWKLKEILEKTFLETRYWKMFSHNIGIFENIDYNRTNLWSSHRIINPRKLVSHQHQNPHHTKRMSFVWQNSLYKYVINTPRRFQHLCRSLKLGIL